MRKPSLRTVARWLWALVMFFLPITSFRYYPHIFGTTQVKPLAFLPLMAYLPVGLWLAWKERRWRWLGALVPLVAFGLAALLSTMWGWLHSPLPLFGIGYLGRALRAWISFGVGLSFLLGALLAHQSEEDIRWSLRWLYVGFLWVALWGSLQIVAIKFYKPLWPLLNKVQKMFSIQGMMPRRISGMAYEPSWFADQLVSLYLPWLVAALLSGYALFRRWWWTAVLLAWAGVLLVFTYSRSGVLVAVGAAAAVVVLGALRWGGQRLRAETLARAWRRSLAAVAVAGLLVLVGGAVLMQNEYFASLFQRRPGQSWVDYFVGARSGARLAYAWAAMSSFDRSPWLGVGLGASGFNLYGDLPEWSATLPEIARYTSPYYHVFPNPKNMYVRLLAETGILGFMLFLAFVLYMLGQAMAWWREETPYARFMGMAGVWILAAVALRWFTQDSLAMPNVWLGLGMMLGPMVQRVNPQRNAS